MIATERLYVTADRSRVVREGDKAAAFLLVPAGAEIPADAVKRYGLDKPAATEQPAPDPPSPAEKPDGLRPETRQTRPARGVRTR